MKTINLSRRAFLKGVSLAGVASAVPNVCFGSGNSIYIPGVNGKVNLSDKIVPHGHFSWGEATHNGERVPEHKYQVQNIVEAARKMEEIREYLGGNPIRVNSWYRDPVSNARVGGATKSRHLEGDAVDFVVSGVKPSEVYSLLDSVWGETGGLGKYNNFTHIDLRGSRARWGN